MSDKDSLPDDVTAPPSERSAGSAAPAPPSGEPVPDTGVDEAVIAEPGPEAAPLAEPESKAEAGPYPESEIAQASVTDVSSEPELKIEPEPAIEEAARRPLLERMGVLPDASDPAGSDQPANVVLAGEALPEQFAEPQRAPGIVPVETADGSTEPALPVPAANPVAVLLAVAANAAETARHQRREPPRGSAPFAPAVTWPAFTPEPPLTAEPQVTQAPTPLPARDEGSEPLLPQRSQLQRVLSFAGRAVAVYAGLLVVLVALFRFVDPPGSALMGIRWLGGTSVEHTWVPIQTISPHLVRAVVVSEDWTFCSHRGIDLASMQQAIEKAKGGLPRGASTISMQVAKNMFLWPSKSYVRKAIEVPLTLVMELLWPKRRILEVYLNVAEWGPGVFGAEAAARHHFQKPASSLTAREAAQLAASLPNPIRRDAGDPGPGTSRKASVVQARMRIAGPVANCVLAPEGVAATQKLKR